MGKREVREIEGREREIEGKESRKRERNKCMLL